MKNGQPPDAQATGLPAAGGLLLVRLFLPFALGYFLSFFFRTINAVIAPQLVAELGLTAATMGFLTSVYFLTFAAMQLPLGLAVDRFGPRRVQAALLVVAAAGALGFGLGADLVQLAVARALIGIGVSGSLMVSITAFVLWLPPQRVPAASGLLMTFGGLGAFAAGAPAESFVAAGGDWRDLFTGLALFAVALAGVVFVTVPERAVTSRTDLRELLSGLMRICTDRMFWRVAPLTMAVCGSALALQGLWAGPWLMQVAGRDSRSVGVHLSVMAIALLVGSATCGPISALATRLGGNLLHAAGVLGLLYVAALAGLVWPLAEWSLLLWGTIGFLINPSAMTYFALAQRFPAGMAARVTTAVNGLVLAASFAFQWLVGRIIALWEPLAPGVYPPEAFQAGFAVVLGFVVLACIWYVGALSAEPPGTGDPGP